MPEKYDPDTSPGVKLLRAFRKLLLNDHKHYQSDLAHELNCSAQTVIRIMNDIEMVIGTKLESGMDGRRKWYRIGSSNPRTLGIHSEEVRYLSVCRDLALPTLPAEIISRVDDTIFNLSMRLTERERQSELGQPVISFFNKGRIDYKGFFPTLQKMQTAIEKKQICRIFYRALGTDEGRWHDFLPHKLVCMNQVLYFYGALLNKNDLEKIEHFNTLALHRMEEVIFTSHTSGVEFPVEDSGAFGMPWHRPCVSRVHFRKGKAARYVAERIWSVPQQIEWLEDGSLELEIVVNSIPELTAWIRSFGDEVIAFEEECAEPKYLDLDNRKYS